MIRRHGRLAAIYGAALALLAQSQIGTADDVRSVLQAAQQRLGSVSSIQYTATGVSGWFGQAFLAGQEWPRRELSSYTRSINYVQRSARDELVFTQPVFGGQRQNTHVNGDRAWTVGPNGPIPQLGAAEERQLHIWLTPHGFVQAALAARDVSFSTGARADVISFTVLDKYRLEGTFDSEHRLTRVATKIANAVLGDTELVATYADYQDFGGIQFPRRIVIVQGGFPTWELQVATVSANADVDLPVPENVAKATVPEVRVVSTKLDEGVWHLTGGSHHSVLVEFRNYLAVIEAPLDERRSLAVLAEAKKLAPGKRVRYVLTTHHHFDHTGGLRTYAAQKATIVTHASNVEYFEKALATPATIVPDAQGRKPKRPRLQGVSDRYVLTDGQQSIEVHATNGDAHTGEYTLIYLPRYKMLVEGDAYSPGPADAPPPATPPAGAVKLYEEIERLGMDVATIAPIHGRGAVPLDELKRTIDRS